VHHLTSSPLTTASRRTSASRVGGNVVPRYADESGAGDRLPTRGEDWLRGLKQRVTDPGVYEDEASREAVELYLVGKPWIWPSERVHLLCDVHADAEAFVRSLVASGGVKRTGAGDDRDTDFELTAEGRDATFLIAGDCLDKGPSNLRLLRSLKHLYDLGANVVLLAGNHDMRAMVGMCCAGNKNPLLAHLFVRMGSKAVPLFREINDAYLQHDSAHDSAADSVLNEGLAEESRLHAELFPDAAWYREFPGLVRGIVADKKIEQELVRIREKATDMERLCAKHGLSLVRVAAVVAKFRELFLTPGGEFAWFFERMQLVHRVGSVLFIHAGVDDSLAARVRTDGIDGINAWFRRLMRDDLFELYHGAIGNGFRTKYRDTDRPLTHRGVRDLHDAGVYAVVHGHRNILHGQRIVFREGMLNVECDASIDQNTRLLHGLEPEGAAVTTFWPDGRVVGISTDHPTAKVFDVARCGVLTQPGLPLGRSVAKGNPMGSDDSNYDTEESEMERETSQDGKLSFDSYMTREEAVAYFEAIVKGLKAGEIHFRRNEQELTLATGTHVDVEVKASRKGKKQKVEIGLSWRTEKPVDLLID